MAKPEFKDTRIIPTVPQYEMLQKECPYPLFVGGLGSGKSYTLVLCALRDLLNNPGANIGIYSPTYDLNRLNLEPRFLEMLDGTGLPHTYNKSTSIISVHGYGDLIFRSMDNPDKIIAYEVFRSHCDEMDTLPLKKAKRVWDKIIARNRQKITINDEVQENGVSAYSTPEGFLFTYDHWKLNARPGYEYVQASTSSNPHLPSNYIKNLYNTYTKELVDAYVLGLWTNLTSGRVYTAFDRKTCHHTYLERPGRIHIGVDFNVMFTCGILAQYIDGVLHIFGEITGMYDSPALVTAVSARYHDRPQPHITAYPDASGKNRHTQDASTSDHTILRKIATLNVKKSNPAIKDRYMSLNNALEKGWVTIDTEACPVLTAALEQQGFLKGSPDKTSGYDHPLDALGYMVYKFFPIVKHSFSFGVAA